MSNQQVHAGNRPDGDRVTSRGAWARGAGWWVDHAAADDAWERQHAAEWARVDQKLRSIAARRAALDAEEANLLRYAEEVKLWRAYGFGSLLEYLERALGYAPRTAVERLRVARAIAELPLIAEALEQGELAHSAVRELSRVAVPDTEAVWLEAARGKSLREIEAMVSGHRPGNLPTDETEPRLHRKTLTLEVSPETYDLWRKLHALAAEEHGQRLSDDELIPALFRRAYGNGRDEGRGPRGDTPAYKIALKQCPDCKRAWQYSGGRDIEVDRAVAECAACDAMHLGSLDASVPERTTTTVTARKREQVLARDGHGCTVPGCRRNVGLDLHHIEYQSRGGGHDLRNLTTICDLHHRAVHHGKLIIRGTAPDRLIFEFRKPRDRRNVTDDEPSAPIPLSSPVSTVSCRSLVSISSTAPQTRPAAASGTSSTAAPGPKPAAASESRPATAPASGPATAPASGPAAALVSGSAAAPESRPAAAPASGPAAAPESRPAAASGASLVAALAPRAAAAPESRPAAAPESRSVTARACGVAAAPESRPVTARACGAAAAPESRPAAASGANSAALAPRAAAAPESRPAAAPESRPAAAPESRPAAAPESKSAAAPESKSAAVPESRPAAAPESRPAAAPESKSAAAPESRPATAPESRPAAAPESKPAAASGANSVAALAPRAAAPESRPAAATESRPAAATESRPAAATESRPAAAPESRPAAAPESRPAAAPESRPAAASESGPAAAPESGPAAAPESGPAAAPESRPAAASEVSLVAALAPRAAAAPESRSAAAPESRSVAARAWGAAAAPESSPAAASGSGTLNALMVSSSVLRASSAVASAASSSLEAGIGSFAPTWAPESRPSARSEADPSHAVGGAGRLSQPTLDGWSVCHVEQSSL